MKNNFPFFKITGVFPIMFALLLAFLFSPVVGWGQINLFTNAGTVVTISGLPAPVCGSDVGAYTCDGCWFSPFFNPGPSQAAVQAGLQNAPHAKRIKVKKNVVYYFEFEVNGPFAYPLATGGGTEYHIPIYSGLNGALPTSFGEYMGAYTYTNGQTGGYAKFTALLTFPNGTTDGYLAIPYLESYVFGDPVQTLFILPFVVEGVLEAETPILGTTVQPQLPYLVLHAPPGDGSSSEFQENTTTCREFTDTYAEASSNSANLAVKLGVAGSLGFIATVDFEFSVTFSGGVTAEDLAITTTSKQVCVSSSSTFATTALPGAGAGDGDVFIGYGTDLAYGVYRFVAADANTCTAKIDTGLIYAPTGIARRFAYTKEAILSDIALQESRVNDNGLSAVSRDNAQNQIDVWNQVLAMNLANTNNPNNVLMGSESFSSGVSSSQESSITVLETNSIEVEHALEGTFGVEAVIEVGGSGVTGGYEYKSSKRFGKTQNQTAEGAKVMRYSLSDDDPGDVFNVDVVRDPMYGTPIFRTKAGTKTSCPYQGGFQRDQPKLQHDGQTGNHITSLGNPVGSSATFKLDLCNQSNEVRTYKLKLNALSNLNGAVVSAAGVPLNGNDLGQSFNVAANSCVEDLVIEVKMLSTSSPLSYPNLELFLYAPCEEETIQSSIFASVYFGAATGVNDPAGNSLLSVSPNPTSGLLQIGLPRGKTMDAIRVMDFSGKLVRDIDLKVAVQSYELDLSHLPKGVYGIQARGEGRIFVKKVVVE